MNLTHLVQAAHSRWAGRGVAFYKHHGGGRLDTVYGHRTMQRLHGLFAEDPPRIILAGKRHPSYKVVITNPN